MPDLSFVSLSKVQSPEKVIKVATSPSKVNEEVQTGFMSMLAGFFMNKPLDIKVNQEDKIDENEIDS